MSALICGSFAYDTIMVFHDKFKNHILPDKVHILNVSFLVPSMRREYGGCAGNIAFNLNMLCDKALPMGTVGNDFAPYSNWMDECGISRQYLTVIDDTYTGQAFITTDEDDNQITAFHPGAMNESHVNHVPTNDNIQLGIVSPDGRQGMIDHAEQFAEADIPFVFDPGQGMPMFNGDELVRFMELASWATFNDYEFQLMQERTGLSEKEIAGHVQALIVTRGAEGSVIHAGGKTIDIAGVAVSSIIDPTGCGDAYRAGLLYGLLNDMDWKTTGRIASLMGAIKIEHAGTQNHWKSLAEIEARFNEVFGRSMQ